MKKFLALAAAACLAVLSPGVSAQIAPAEPASPLEISYEVDDGLVTALYHLYGSLIDDFVNMDVRNTGDAEVTVLVESEIEGYTTTASTTVTVPPYGSVSLAQNPRLIPESVERLNSQRTGSFRISVWELAEGEDELLLSNSSDVLLYSRRDHVWIDGYTTEENWDFWAAWITPTDPAVEELLRAAADYTEVGEMGNGYGGLELDSGGTVWDRLQAVWRAEQDYALKYVSTMLTFSPNSSQRIRMPTEVLEQRGGNCIELTLLFASAVEALEMEAAVIKVPGHAFVVVRMDGVNAQYYAVETTMIEWADFTDAVDAGARAYEAMFPHLDAGEFDYYWMDIAAAREKGIMPMPWR